MRSTRNVYLGAIAAAALAWLAPTPDAEVAALTARIGRLGWTSALALLVTLAVSPAGAALGWSAPRRARLRRACGLSAAGLLAGHLALVLGSGWVGHLEHLVLEPHLRSGATAALIVGLLALTSWPRVVRAARLGHWKLLHRALYAAALLAVHHVALAGHADPRHVWALGAAVGALIVVRVTLAIRSRR